MKNMIENNKKSLLVVAVIVLIGAVLVLANLRNRGNVSGNYQTEVIERGDLSTTVKATGTVRPIQSAALTWKASGTVEKVDVGLGDTVDENDVLAMLKQSSLPQNIILAEADLATAEQALEDLLNSSTAQANSVITLREAQEAYEDAVEYRESLEDEIDIKYIVWKGGQPESKTRRGYASDEEKAEVDEDVALKKGQVEDAQRTYDRLKDGPNTQDVAAAEARVAAAQATLEQAIISAPFGGVITDTSVLSGDQVTVGEIAFQVDDTSQLQIDVEVSEVDINNLSVGQEVTVNLDAVRSKNYHGEVISIAGTGVETAGSVNFKVTIEISDADELIKSGMTATVLIQVRNIEDALLVPKQAIQVDGGKRVIYVIGDDGVLTPVEVRLGVTSDIYSEVMSGDLKEGDTIILNPSLLK